MPVFQRVVDHASHRPRFPTKNPPKSLISTTLNARSVRTSRMRIDNDDFVIHVSDLIKVDRQYEFCPREHALHFFNKKTYHSAGLSPGYELLFETGHAIHRHVVEKFIQHSPYGQAVWGLWTCDCKRLQHNGYRQLRNANVCNRCRTAATHYAEYNLFVERFRLSGHPDLLVKWGDWLVLYEIKTIDRKDVSFDSMRYPLAEHTIQGSIYHWMLSILGHKVYPRVRYIYVDRSTSKLWAGHPYKEFEQAPCDMERIAPFLAKAKSILESRKTGVLPPRVCKAIDNPRAQHCRVAIPCFERRSNNVVQNQATSYKENIKAKVSRRLRGWS